MRLSTNTTTFPSITAEGTLAILAWAAEDCQHSACGTDQRRGDPLSQAAGATARPARAPSANELPHRCRRGKTRRLVCTPAGCTPAGSHATNTPSTAPMRRRRRAELPMQAELAPTTPSTAPVPLRYRLAFVACVRRCLRSWHPGPRYASSPLLLPAKSRSNEV